ncbi:phage tail tape measure protein [Escherichia coli]|uniref:phage tail tape measure protein n=1 Tax=Escherichia coli TaxID=562 RepID=UPI002892EE7F|nr:phage tail tape measure protein [Escherichia coli]WNK03470.1 phage tail tape measure protein [Escherichia coli]
MTQQRLELLLEMTDRLTRPLRAAGRQIRGFADTSRAAFGNIAAGGAALWGVGAAIKGALQPAIEMDRALGEVKSLGVAESGLRRLRAAAIDFTMEYGGAAEDFVRASYDIQSAITGLTDKELSRFTTASATVASATKSSTQTITAYMGTMYGIFQDQAAAMGKSRWVEQIAGQTATAVQMFKTTGDNMSAAFTTLGASAKSAGIDAAEQFAVLGQLQATMSGSEAGTKYKAFLASVGSAQKTLGLNFVNKDGTMKSVVEIMKLIRGKFGDLSRVADSDLLKKAFGSDEAVAMIKLLNADIDGLEKNIKTLGNVDGMSKAIEMAQAMADPWEQAAAIINGIRIEIGTQLLPVLYPFIQKSNEGGKAFVSWLRLYPNITRSLGLLAGVFLSIAAAGAISNIVMGVFTFVTKGLIAPVTGLIKLLRLSALRNVIAAMATSAYAAAQQYLNRVMAVSVLTGRGFLTTMMMMSGPVLLAGAAIAALVAMVWKFWQPIKAFVSGFIQGFSEAWKSVSSGSSALSAIGDAFGIVWNAIKTVLTWLGNLLTPMELTGEQFGRVSDAGAAFGRIVAMAINWILAPTEIMLGLLSKVWQALCIIVEGYAEIWDGIDVTRPLDSLKNLASGILNIFSNLWQLVKQSFSDSWGWIVSKLNMIPGVNIDAPEIPAPPDVMTGSQNPVTGDPQLLTGGRVTSAGPGGVASQIRSSTESETKIDNSQRIVNVNVQNPSPERINEWMELHAY